MTLQNLTWFLVAMSLAGNIFVVKKNVIGQWLWLVSNFGWVSYNLYIGEITQASLFLAYLGLSIWAIVSWSREDKKAASATN